MSSVRLSFLTLIISIASWAGTEVHRVSELQPLNFADRLVPTGRAPDAYRVHLLPRHIYSVTMRTAATVPRSSDPLLVLHDAAKQLSVWGVDTASFLFVPDRDSVFTIQASDFLASQTAGQKLHYSLRVERIGTIQHFESAIVEASETDRVRIGCYHKLFYLRLEKDRRYEFVVTTREIDPILRIDDTDGRRTLATSSDRQTHDQTRLSFVAPETTTYRFVVTTYPPSQKGKFTLSVRD